MKKGCEVEEVNWLNDKQSLGKRQILLDFVVLCEEEIIFIGVLEILWNKNNCQKFQNIVQL